MIDEDVTQERLRGIKLGKMRAQRRKEGLREGQLSGHGQMREPTSVPREGSRPPQEGRRLPALGHREVPQHL